MRTPSLNGNRNHLNDMYPQNSGRDVHRISNPVKTKVSLYRRLYEQLQTRLAALATQQDELTEVREQLLVDRESVVASGKRIREQRIRTGDAEVGLMDAFRRHYNAIASPIPEDISSAYSIVEEQRNKLGFLEDNHLHTEQTLGASEWSFLESENNLYQYDLQQLLSEGDLDDLSEPANAEMAGPFHSPESFPPSLEVQYLVATAEHDQLVKQFNVLRRNKADVTTFNDLEAEYEGTGMMRGEDSASVPEQPFSDVLAKVTDSEVKLQDLKAKLGSHTDVEMVRSRRMSEPHPQTGQIHKSLSVPSRACSDSAIPGMTDDVAVRDRIKDWLLDRLKKSAIEKTQYLNILGDNLNYVGDSLEFEDWDDRITELWSSDMAGSFSQFNLPSGDHRTGQHIELDTNSNHVEHRIHNAVLEQQKLGLDFDANFNYEPVAALSSRKEEVNPQLQIDKVFAEDYESLPQLGTSDGTVSGGQLPALHSLTTQHTLAVHAEESIQMQSANYLSVEQPETTQTTTQRFDSAQNSIFGELPRVDSHSRCLQMNPQASQDVRSVSSGSSRSGSTASSTSTPEGTMTRHSRWMWSQRLQRHYSYVFGKDDTILEVLWSDSENHNANKSSSMVLESEGPSQMTHPSHRSEDSVSMNSSIDISSDMQRERARSDLFHLPAASRRCAPNFHQRRYVSYDEAMWELQKSVVTKDAHENGFQRIPATKQRGFFVPGRVFKVIWPNAGDDKFWHSSQSSRDSSPVRFHRDKLSTIRCFVVVRNKGNFSQCFPVEAYQNVSISRLGLRIQDMGTIFTTESQPTLQPGESFDKHPLQVVPNTNESLPPESRIYYGKTYAIDHQIRVKDIGMVSEDRVYLLHFYYAANSHDDYP